MKVFNFLAVAALTLTPALAAAQTQPVTCPDGQTLNEDGQCVAVVPGGTAQGGLPVFSLGAIPTGAVVVGTTVVLAGVIIGVVAATDDDDPTTTTTTTTTN